MEMFGDFLGFEHLYDARILTEDGSQFPVHRILLALRSKYFHNLLCIEGSENTEILIPSISGSVMKIVLDYLYTGSLDLTGHNLSEVLLAAYFLGIDSLFHNCRRLASRNLTTKNCISVFLAGEETKDWDMLKASIRFIIVNFQRILRDPMSSFHDLPIQTLKQFLALDNINVSSEYQIWSAIVTWIGKNLEQRKIYVADLISCIRVPKGRSDLVSEILSHPFVTENPSNYRIKEILRRGDRSNRHRIPNKMFIITKIFLSHSDYSEGIKVFLTFDEDIDFWRNIGSKIFRPDVVLHVSGPIIMMFDSGLNVIYTFNCITKRWTSITPPSITRREYNVVKLGQYVYMIGGIIPGDEEDGVSQSIEKYNFETEEWERIAQPEYGLSQGAAAVIDNRICVIGTIFGFLSEIIMAQSYNPNTNSWQSFNPPNIYRRQFAMVIYNNKLYVLGGHSSEGLLKSVEVYDTQENLWNDFEEMPFSYYMPKAIVIKDVLYVYDDHADDNYGFRYPPVRWNVLSQRWEVVEASSPFCDLHLYKFCVINDFEVILQMRQENRDHATEWKASPFFNYT